MHLSFKVILILLFLVIAMIAFYGWRFYRLIKISETIIVRTIPYTLSWSASGVSLLVLGDSTAVWVGADNLDDSIAALLTKRVGATRVEHHWVSWAIVADVKDQVAEIEKQEYDYILLQIWGNDMTRFHNLATVAVEYEALIASLPRHKILIVTSCGNLWGAQIFPHIMGYIYEYVSRSYHTKFAEIVTRYGGIYVDLFDERRADPFIASPEIYLAADLFHPSSIGYRYWFTKIETKLWEKEK